MKELENLIQAIEKCILNSKKICNCDKIAKELEKKYLIIDKKKARIWDIVYGQACRKSIDEDINKYISTREGKLIFIEEKK